MNLHSLRRYCGLMHAAAQMRDADAFAAGFDDLDPEQCDAAGKIVLAYIEKLTGYTALWGWASQRIPWSYTRGITDVFKFPPAAPKQKTSRSQLCSVIFRLLRQNTTGLRLLAETRAANANLFAPLSDDDLKSLIRWCVDNCG